jgi:hypothetical protein
MIEVLYLWVGFFERFYTGFLKSPHSFLEIDNFLAETRLLESVYVATWNRRISKAFLSLLDEWRRGDLLSNESVVGTAKDSEEDQDLRDIRCG